MTLEDGPPSKEELFRLAQQRDDYHSAMCFEAGGMVTSTKFEERIPILDLSEIL